MLASLQDGTLMAYDEFLAERVRAAIGARRGIVEKKMFGGLAFMLHGNMACGVVGEKLMLRLGEEGAAAAMCEPRVGPMDFTGKPIKSMAFVEPEGLEREEDLVGWIGKALDFARALPRK